MSWVDDLVRPDRRLWRVEGGVLSALGPNERGSRYDRGAALYDRVVGNGLYNRAVWGARSSSYSAFAAAAVADGRGPLLDVGCGSAVFTAAAYRDTDRPLVLVDRSAGMLARAAARLRGAGGRVVFVQADLFDLPFLPGRFATVACHGLLHLFEDAAGVLRVLGGQVSPGGSMYATSLVAETAAGRRMLRLLHRRGEAAAPRDGRAVVDAARAGLGVPIRARREGSMLFLVTGSGAASPS